MSDLTCDGSEWSVEECSWAMPDDACMAHASDVVVYCTKSARAGAQEGAVRLIGEDGSPSIDGTGRPEIFHESTWTPICSSGLSTGAATVICKSMGFTGTSGSSKFSVTACGSSPPGVSELACSGTESAPLACPHEAGDDVFCAASESITLSLALGMGRHRVGLQRKSFRNRLCDLLSGMAAQVQQMCSMTQCIGGVHRIVQQLSQ